MNTCTTEISFKVEKYPEVQDESRQRLRAAFCSCPVYASAEGLDMLEIRGGSELWRSCDNGDTWSMCDSISEVTENSDGTFLKWMLGPLVLDPASGALVRFESSMLYKEHPDTLKTYYDSVRALVPNNMIPYYRISRDGGKSWSELKQLIETGAEFDEKHYAARIVSGEGECYLGAVPPYPVLNDGAVMLPFQARTKVNSELYGTIQPGRFRMSVNDDDTLDCKSEGCVPGGGCEQTIARLKDGRLLNVLRIQGTVEPYFFDMWLRPYSVSSDEGKSWSKPKPLCWDDGGGLTSPRAWSQLIRSDKNGKLYWIANILPRVEEISALKEKFPSRADPRYPLVIAEVDEETLTLKRSSAVTLADREDGETDLLRFSNFYCYNDRATGEIVMLMQKSYHEDQPDLDNMPHPAWRFRITVPE